MQETLLPLMKGGKKQPGAIKIFYEYYWESAFPVTPTVQYCTDRYKFIRSHGWILNELYDLQQRSLIEVNNRSGALQHQENRAATKQLWLDGAKPGLEIPLKPSIMQKIGDQFCRPKEPVGICLRIMQTRPCCPLISKLLVKTPTTASGGDAFILLCKSCI